MGWGGGREEDPPHLPLYYSPSFLGSSGREKSEEKDEDDMAEGEREGENCTCHAAPLLGRPPKRSTRLLCRELL